MPTQREKIHIFKIELVRGYERFNKIISTIERNPQEEREVKKKVDFINRKLKQIIFKIDNYLQKGEQWHLNQIPFEFKILSIKILKLIKTEDNRESSELAKEYEYFNKLNNELKKLLGKKLEIAKDRHFTYDFTTDSNKVRCIIAMKLRDFYLKEYMNLDLDIKEIENCLLIYAEIIENIIKENPRFLLHENTQIHLIVNDYIGNIAAEYFPESTYQRIYLAIQFEPKMLSDNKIRNKIRGTIIHELEHAIDHKLYHKDEEIKRFEGEHNEVLCIPAREVFLIFSRIREEGIARFSEKVHNNQLEKIIFEKEHLILLNQQIKVIQAKEAEIKFLENHTTKLYAGGFAHMIGEEISYFMFLYRLDIHKRIHSKNKEDILKNIKKYSDKKFFIDLTVEDYKLAKNTLEVMRHMNIDKFFEIANKAYAHFGIRMKDSTKIILEVNNTKKNQIKKIIKHLGF